MGIVSGIVVYLMIWWTALFMVLPFGVRQQSGGVEKGVKGAPEKPDIKKKFLITTVLSTAIWLIIFGLVQSDIISFREMAKGLS